MRYEWFVPDTAGPASRDGPVVAYAYVSGVDHIKHINAGGQQCQAVGQETGSEVIIKPGCCVGPTHRGAAFVVFWKLMCAAALCVVATDLVDCRPRACALARPAHYCRLTCTCCASGLVGPLAIYAKGKLDEPGVDREIPLLFNIQNEMQSIYFQVGSGSVVCCVKTPARTRTLFLSLWHSSSLFRVSLSQTSVWRLPRWSAAQPFCVGASNAPGVCLGVFVICCRCCSSSAAAAGQLVLAGQQDEYDD